MTCLSACDDIAVRKMSPPRSRARQASRASCEREHGDAGTATFPLLSTVYVPLLNLLRKVGVSSARLAVSGREATALYAYTSNYAFTLTLQCFRLATTHVYTRPILKISRARSIRYRGYRPPSQVQDPYRRTNPSTSGPYTPYQRVACLRYTDAPSCNRVSPSPQQT